MTLTEALLRNQYVSFDVNQAHNSLNVQTVSTILSNMAYYGFTLSKDTFHALQTLSDDALVLFWQNIEPALQEITATNRNMDQFVVYKNFPSEVLSMSDSQYWVYQICMYLGVPNEYFTEEQKERPNLSEKFKEMKVLQLAPTDIVDTLLNKLIAQTTKWSDNQKEMFNTFIQHKTPNVINITHYGFKENGIHAIEYALSNNISFYVKDITDVLRLCAKLSKCSLRTKVKFKKFKNKERRLICNAIEGILTVSPFYAEQDIARKKEIWKLLFNHIHIFDYKTPNLHKVYIKLYKKELKTFQSKVIHALQSKNLSIFSLLKDRPAELIKLFGQIYSTFGEICIPHVATALTQLNVIAVVKFKKYINSVNNRKFSIYAPNGNWTKAQFTENTKTLNNDVIYQLNTIIDQILIENYKSLYPNGIVVDTQLSNVKLQTNDQELAEYGRGTSFPIPENITFIRTASYWQNANNRYNSWFDNGWNFFDENWNPKSTCCWDSPTISGDGAIFSGDPTNSKDSDGKACQMIDLYLNKLRDSGIRYAVWSILCYSGISFANTEEVLATLQWGENPEEGNLYEPKRAQMIFPLKGNNLTKYIAYIDLVENKLVYMDANLYGRISSAQENIDLLSKRMPAFVEYLDTLPSIIDLFPNAPVLTTQSEYSESTATAFLYTDKDINIKNTKAYVFKAVNQQNQFDNIKL